MWNVLQCSVLLPYPDLYFFFFSSRFQICQRGTICIAAAGELEALLWLIIGAGKITSQQSLCPSNRIPGLWLSWSPGGVEGCGDKSGKWIASGRVIENNPVMLHKWRGSWPQAGRPLLHQCHTMEASPGKVCLCSPSLHHNRSYWLESQVWPRQNRDLWLRWQ